MYANVAVCAETVVRDSDTNSVSVFNIIEEIKAPQFPALVAKFATLIIVEREETDPVDLTCEVLFTLNGAQFGSGTVHSSFNESPRVRVILVGSDLPLKEPGTLLVTWKTNSEVIASYRIPIGQSEDAVEATSKRDST